MGKPLKIFWAGTGLRHPPRGTLPFNWLHESLWNRWDPQPQKWQDIPLDAVRDIARKCQRGDNVNGYQLFPGALSDLDHEISGYAPEYIQLIADRAKAFKDAAPDVPLCFYWFTGSPNNGWGSDENIRVWNSTAQDFFARAWDTAEPLVAHVDAMTPCCYLNGPARFETDLEFLSVLCRKIKERFPTKPLYAYLQAWIDGVNELTPEQAEKYLLTVGGAVGEGVILWGDGAVTERVFRQAIEANMGEMNLEELTDDAVIEGFKAYAAEVNRRQLKLDEAHKKFADAEKAVVDGTGEDSVQ